MNYHLDDGNISEIFGDKIESDVPCTPKSVRQVEDQTDCLMSPGTFFSMKSGRLGSLGGNVSKEERVRTCKHFLKVF